VAREILRSGGKKYSDFVVLYRTNAQSRVLEEIFLKRSIPYKIVGGIKFYQRKEIKDVVSYLRFIKNPKDYLSLERIINEPKRGLGEKTIEKWIAIAKESDSDLLQVGFHRQDERGDGQDRSGRSYPESFFGKRI
jgi:DNA helicase-2/ATP-dependent DNA helicase PcrA